MNEGETFQRAMEIYFADEKNNILVIYLDEIIVFPQSDEEHITRRLRMFRRCKKFGISLNPKK